MNGIVRVIEWRSERFALNKSLIEIWSLVLLRLDTRKKVPDLRGATQIIQYNCYLCLCRTYQVVLVIVSNQNFQN